MKAEYGKFTIETNRKWEWLSSSPTPYGFDVWLGNDLIKRVVEEYETLEQAIEAGKAWVIGALNELP